MKATPLHAVLPAFCCIIIANVNAQDTRAFNQNASRSNHTRLLNADEWTIGLSSGTSFATKSDQSTLFRGNSLASKLSVHYYFDKIGLGISSGVIPGAINDNALNRFIAERKFPADQLQITKSKPSNGYLLAGPSVRFGNRVLVMADIKGGIFFNDPGAVTINQQGVTRSLYRFEAGDKNLFPGFAGGISIAYPVSNNLQFFINTDYLQSRSAIRILDPSAGIDVATQLNRDVKLMTAGIGITKTFGGNDAAAKKHIGNVKYEEISMQQDNAGRRKRMEEIEAQRTISNSSQNCGPVTQRIINPDGTTEEMVFSCPNDAIDYATKIKTTVPKQTQGATFGEKVNAGLHAAGSSLAQRNSFGEKVNAGLHAAGSALANGSSRKIISGRLTWLDEEAGGIVTNKSVSSVSSLAGGSGGAASASYARITPNTSFGTMVRLQARESGSGMATGKRSAREKGSGLATGRRQYEPVFADNTGSICNPCMANVKSNPLYSDKGAKGENPLYESKSELRTFNANGVPNVNVALIDINTGATIAQTQTEASGDFFFANVPDGMYTVKITAAYLSKKGYDYMTTGATDVQGTVTLAPPPIQLSINTEQDDDAAVQKAGISTSRSNIRCRSLTIIEADTDGDGEFESVKASAALSDGTIENLSASTGQSSGKRTLLLESGAMQNSRRRVEVLKSNKQGDPNANRITSISITSGNSTTATANFKDGRTQDITSQLVTNTSHNGVHQYSIVVADLDNDGFDDAVVNSLISVQGSSERKMIPVTFPDFTGAQKNVVRPMLPGGGVVSAMLRPIGPIKGVIVKGGTNGNMRTTETDENGAFEFLGLEAGNNILSFEQEFFIDDETTVIISSNKAQDHNSSRSNKTASGIAVDPNTNSGGATTKVADHNSSRSNKSSSIIAPDPNNDGDVVKKNNVGPVKWAAPESLKSIVAEADLDGDGVYETDVTLKVRDIINVNEKGEISTPQQKAGVSTSRSNIRTRNSLQPVGNDLFIGYGTAEINGKTVPVKIIYKGGGLKDTLKTQV
jgi:hypothetical protein